MGMIMMVSTAMMPSAMAMSFIPFNWDSDLGNRNVANDFSMSHVGIRGTSDPYFLMNKRSSMTALRYLIESQYENPQLQCN